MTPRQREVIALLGEGPSTREIGDPLRIALHTVKSQVPSVLEKLELMTRLQVAAYAHWEEHLLT